MIESNREAAVVVKNPGRVTRFAKLASSGQEYLLSWQNSELLQVMVKGNMSQLQKSRFKGEKKVV